MYNRWGCIDSNGPNELDGTNVQCSTCGGCGLVKVDLIRCEVCKQLNLYGCMKCKGGFTTQPYMECADCMGTGQIDSF